MIRFQTTLKKLSSKIYFCLTIFLITGVFLALQSITTSQRSVGFIDRLETITLLQNDSERIHIELLRLHGSSQRFRETFDPRSEAHLQESAQEAQTALSLAIEEQDFPEDAHEKLLQIQAHVARYVQSFDEWNIAREQRDQLANGEFQPLIDEIFYFTRDVGRKIHNRLPSSISFSITSTFREPEEHFRHSAQDFLHTRNLDSAATIKQALSQFRTTITEIDSQHISPEDASQLLEYLDLANGLFDELVQSETRYRELIDVHIEGEALQFLRLSSEVDSIVQDAESQLIETASLQAKMLGRQGLVASLVLISVSVAMIMYFHQTLMVPLTTITHIFERIAQGKKVRHVPHTSQNNEMGELARAAKLLESKIDEANALLNHETELVDELQSKNRMLETQSADLQRSNDDLAKFAYVASHDLQEPLRAVVSYLQLIERRYKDKLDTDGKEFIGYAVGGASRMQKLIRSLLLYSRVGTQKNPQLETFNCQLAVEHALDNLSDALKECSTKPAFSIKPLPLIHGDPEQITRVFQNLIANSIRYRSEAPLEIKIESTRKGDFNQITVTDNGQGFEQQYADRIFVIFQRLASRELHPESTGIGLSICKRIVEGHGGRIWAESSVGHGANFVIELPVVHGSQNSGQTQ